MKQVQRRTCRQLTALLFGLMVNSITFAQLTDTEDPNDTSTIVYTADYFADFSPVSVNDMISRIPGIGLAMRGGSSGGGGFSGGGSGGSSGGNNRGLGSGEGEILINGQRMAGKNNGAQDQLSRISADQVDYIEIIRGTSEGLDVSGGAQVVNVVLLQMPSRSSTATELNIDRSSDGTVKPGGKISYSGQTGDFNYLFHVEAEPRYRKSLSTENSYSPDYQLREVRKEESTRDQTEFATSMNLGYVLGRSVLQFNALYDYSDPPSELERETFDLTTNQLQRQIEDSGFKRSNWEVGGNYEYGFASDAKYRFLFIVNDREFDSSRERFDVLTDSVRKNLFLQNGGRNRERIGRTSYTWNPAATQVLELGVERAQTIVDSNLRMGLDIPGTPSAAHGNLVPVAVSNSSSTVEEIRYETFANHNWQLNSKMSLESAVVYESSTITQSGDVSKKRDFEFVRPKVDLRYNFTPELQLRAGIEKDVAQLSFSDFSASIDFSDFDKNTQAGNPEIVQEQSWRYQANLEYRLPNSLGVVNTQVYYRDYEDVIDRVDVSKNPGDLESARGNIGDGIRYGVNLDISSKMSFVGLPDALLTLGLGAHDSEVTDPFLHIKRRMQEVDRWSARIGFRHDITAQAMSYGFNFASTSNEGSSRREIDIIDIEELRNQPFLTSFVEKRAFGDIAFRFEAMNLLDSEFCRTRTRFLGATVDGLVEEIEDYCNGSGPQLSLKIRKTF